MSSAPPSTDRIADQLRSVTGPRWLQVGKLFSGDRTEVLSDAHLVYDGEGIRYVGTASPPADLVRDGQTRPDLTLPAHTALPGLTDAHTHLFLTGGEVDTAARSAYLKLSGEEHLQSAARRLERLVALGITAVREAGDKTEVGLALQRRHRSADRGIMPYVDAPGAAINHEKRYGSFMARPTEEYGTPDATVDARVAHGAHRIKLLATGIINFEKGVVTAKPQMPADELIAFVLAARKHGKQTMVHCTGHDGIANCIAAQVDTIEHGFFIDEDQLARIRDLDMVWVPTFAPVQFQIDHPEIIGWSETVCDNLRRIVDSHAQSLMHAQKIGVRVIAGSDAGSHGVAHGWGFLRELELMQTAGLSAPEVLFTATGAGVERMDYTEQFGVLKPGAKSRFLLTAQNVLQDVGGLREDKVVVFDQTVLAGPQDENEAGL